MVIHSSQGHSFEPEIGSDMIYLSLALPHFVRLAEEAMTTDAILGHFHALPRYEETINCVVIIYGCSCISDEMKRRYSLVTYNKFIANTFECFYIYTGIVLEVFTEFRDIDI